MIIAETFWSVNAAQVVMLLAIIGGFVTWFSRFEGRVRSAGDALKVLSQDLLESISNLVFIAVHGCTIEVPIPNLRRTFYRRCNFTCRGMVRAEGSQTDCWHPGTGVQSPLWYKCWINVSVNQRS